MGQPGGCYGSVHRHRIPVLTPEERMTLEEMVRMEEDGDPAACSMHSSTACSCAAIRNIS